VHVPGRRSHVQRREGIDVHEENAGLLVIHPNCCRVIRLHALLRSKRRAPTITFEA
jgi:hypothetical protein